MMTLDTGKADAIALDATTISIQGMIDQMSGEFDDINWKEMVKKHRVLCGMLEKAWNVRCVGGIWVARILLLYAASLGSGAVATMHRDSCMREAYTAICIVFAFGGSSVLLRLAHATSLVSNPRASSKSLLSCAHDYAGKPS